MSGQVWKLREHFWFLMEQEQFLKRHGMNLFKRNKKTFSSLDYWSVFKFRLEKPLKLFVGKPTKVFIEKTIQVLIRTAFSNLQEIIRFKRLLSLSKPLFLQVFDEKACLSLGLSLHKSFQAFIIKP